MFLGVKCEVANFQADKEKGCTFSLIMPDNPLNDYVELPENLSALNYSNMICGVIRGALSTVSLFHLTFNHIRSNSCVLRLDAT